MWAKIARFKKWLSYATRPCNSNRIIHSKIMEAASDRLDSPIMAKKPIFTPELAWSIKRLLFMFKRVEMLLIITFVYNKWRTGKEGIRWIILIRRNKSSLKVKLRVVIYCCVYNCLRADCDWGRGSPSHCHLNLGSWCQPSLDWGSPCLHCANWPLSLVG